MSADLGSGLLDLQARIAELGPDMGGDVPGRTAALYREAHPGALRHEVVRDLSYGPHHQHVLDLHLPTDRGDRRRPVLCFVHGGGFVGGDKARSGQPYYDNVCRWAVANGWIAVNINYRLAPGANFPAGAEDVAAATHWIDTDVAQYGGDPAAVVVMGHSAGAAHVATMIARPALTSGSRHPLKGAVLCSGIYEPSRGAGIDLTDYYGNSPSELAAGSCVDGLCGTDVPVLVTVAEYDPADVQDQAQLLLDALARRQGRPPRFLRAAGHNHFSVMFHIGTEDTRFTEPLGRFVEA